MTYRQTADEAQAKAQVLALCILADRLEHLGIVMRITSHPADDLCPEGTFSIVYSVPYDDKDEAFCKYQLVPCIAEPYLKRSLENIKIILETMLSKVPDRRDALDFEVALEQFIDEVLELYL